MQWLYGRYGRYQVRVWLIHLYYGFLQVLFVSLFLFALGFLVYSLDKKDREAEKGRWEVRRCMDQLTVEACSPCAQKAGMARMYEPCATALYVLKKKAK